MQDTILDVTARIQRRSGPLRRAYLSKIDRLLERPPGAQRMGCANVAHAFAALPKLKFPRRQPEFSCSINHLRWIFGLGF